MLALSLWPEWTWATFHLDKDVENRTWAPPPELIGRDVALHSGKHIGGRQAKVARAEGLEAVCGSAEEVGWILDEVVSELDGRVRIGARRPEEKEARTSWITPSHIVGVRRLVRVIHESDTGPDPVRESRWFVGPFGWVWGERRLLATPIRCAGAQRLWSVPLPIREQMEAQLPEIVRPREVPEVVNRHWYSGELPRPNMYIGRGSPLGNPFPADRSDPAVALGKYRAWLWEKIRLRDAPVVRALEKITPEHHLVCSCKPRPCHGDVVVRAWQWLQARNAKEAKA